MLLRKGFWNKKHDGSRRRSWRMLTRKTATRFKPEPVPSNSQSYNVTLYKRPSKFPSFYTMFPINTAPPPPATHTRPPRHDRHFSTSQLIPLLYESRHLLFKQPERQLTSFLINTITEVLASISWNKTITGSPWVVHFCHTKLTSVLQIHNSWGMQMVSSFRFL
jgi:hypothetical protein